jgi:2-oxo-4-hydroxy-4-carboxy-5-ureidoimidazoline decarboxylase
VCLVALPARRIGSVSTTRSSSRRDVPRRVRGAPLSREEPGLRCFNRAPADTTHDALLACCGSDRWARRLTAHRPYPDLDALLAAADEASYDLAPADLAEALAAESTAVEAPGGDCPHGFRRSVPATALTALRAGCAAYESSFGHAFVMSLEGRVPEEYLDEVLAGIRARLSHGPEEERSVAAEQLRRLARSRLLAMVGRHSRGPRAPLATGTAPLLAQPPRPRRAETTAQDRPPRSDCLFDHGCDPRASGPTSRR